ncbi:hypothetical protein LV89_04021 [Arcicella aurantiaca]|uniref:Lipoprotein n=1 Tax=Arcicella aurantiaca TaxID=591202 RepID=A0A316DMD8_9BACT|nr:hypothetical protein [Arcicella aurantiaca]PWK18886.1 hypothetical protein LV89_04021 [Arcicella aurantiaca]
MKTKIVATLFIFITLITGCNFSDDKSQASYKELEKTISTLELNKKFKIKEIDIADFTQSDTIAIHNFPNKPTLKTRKLSVDYKLKITGENDDFTAQSIVTSNDSLHWQVQQLTITDRKKTESSKKEINYIWDLVKGSKKRYELSHQVKIKQYIN